MKFSTIQIIIILTIIATASIPLKLYTVEFSLPVEFDNLGYTLDALQYSEGEFFTPPKKHPGWPLFVAPFMLLFDSNNFLDYSNLIRVLSLSVALFTIYPVYALGRKFFDQKYSLFLVILFAFEPHLNYISGQGLSEPFYILMYICAFYFILSKKLRDLSLAFVFASFVWWIRIEGVLLFVILCIIYIANLRKSKNSLRNFGICVVIFLVVFSPLFYQKQVQFGNPLYVSYLDYFFVDSYAQLWAENVQEERGGITQYIEDKGLDGFVNKFAISGFLLVVEGLTKISFPFLFILLPFGILFSLRAFDQDSKRIRANWILILSFLGLMCIVFAIINERRFLFPLFPFLMIFAVIPVQRLVEYGLSTFSFSQEKKNAFLIIIIALIIFSSVLFCVGVGKYGYGKVDLEMENEKMEYAKFMVKELVDGRTYASPGAATYAINVKITEDAEIFKNFESNRGEKNESGKWDPYPRAWEPGVWELVNVYGDTTEEMISNGEKYDLKYFAIPGEENTGLSLGSGKGAYYAVFLNDVYQNEQNYPYLTKIFDSQEYGFKKFHIKVFEIDYVRFHEYMLDN